MKKIFCTFLVIAVLVSLSGCMASAYEDTNGEDNFSLQTLTDQDIIQGTNTTSFMSSTVTLNNKTVCKVQTMSGVDELFEKRMKNETLDMVVSCEIVKGNARLVLVIDDKIVHDFALNENNQQFILENVTGKVCLKIAGESTGYSVTYKVQ